MADKCSIEMFFFVIVFYINFRPFHYDIAIQQVQINPLRSLFSTAVKLSSARSFVMEIPKPKS